MSNKLNTLKIGFGESKNFPIKLTEEELNILLTIIEDENITNKSFNGFITSDVAIKSGQAYLLGLNSITYLGSIITDAYEIIPSAQLIKENNSVTFNTIGINSDILNFKVLNVIILSGTISSDELKSKITINNNVMTVSSTNNYSGWEANIIIRTTPKYESSEKQDITIKVLGKTKPTSIDISGPDNLNIGNNEFIVNKIPNESNLNIIDLNVTYKKINTEIDNNDEIIEDLLLSINGNDNYDYTEETDIEVLLNKINE